MYAPGLTIDSWMNCVSDPRFACFAYCTSLSRSGPMLPVAPAGLNVWQLPQPFDWNTASPGGPAAARPPLRYQVLKSFSFMITTWLRISAWPSPQSSVQMTGNVPVWIGVTTIVLNWPGTASCFCDSTGTQKEWMTSFDVMRNFVLRFSGSVR